MQINQWLEENIPPEERHKYGMAAHMVYLHRSSPVPDSGITLEEALIWEVQQLMLFWAGLPSKHANKVPFIYIHSINELLKMHKRWHTGNIWSEPNVPHKHPCFPIL